jgi:5-methylthioadenosine/S-adenosylhomocysteine deaminase
MRCPLVLSSVSQRAIYRPILAVVSNDVTAPLMLDLLITNATVLTVNATNEVLQSAAIAVRDGVIVDLGPSSLLSQKYRANRLIDAHGGIVLPGFINLHAHLPMTLLRGWADDRDLQGFLARVFPAEDLLVANGAVGLGADLAFAESLRAGITTTLDMYFHPLTVAASATAAGARVANGPVFFDFPGPDQLPWDARMADARLVLESSRGNLTAGRWVNAHSTYTMSREHLLDTYALAQEFGARFNIHAAENAAEVAQVVAACGRRPVELLHDLGLLGPTTVLAHAVDLLDSEIDMIAASGASVAHNPLSNMKLASGFCRVPDLLAAGVTVGIGTDGTASSNDLDLYMALRFAATIHKGKSLDPLVVPAATALRMATIDGARALGLGDTLGSLEVGKRADIQILAHDHPNLIPSFDPISTVAFAAGRGDVCTVVVDGKVVVDQGGVLNIDMDRVASEVNTFANRLQLALAP